MFTPADPAVKPAQFTEPGVYWLNGGCIEVIEGAKVPQNTVPDSGTVVPEQWFWEHQG